MTDQSMEVLREEPTNPHLLRGFGPLVVGLVLIVLMTLLAPTVAREGITVQPRATTTSTPVDAR